MRTCSFTYRVEGIPRFQLGIEELFTGIRTLGLNHVPCSEHDRHQTNEEHWEMLFNPSLDGIPSTLSEGDIRAIRRQKWLQLPIVDMVRQAQLDIADVLHAPHTLTLLAGTCGRERHVGYAGAHQQVLPFLRAALQDYDQLSGGLGWNTRPDWDIQGLL